MSKGIQRLVVTFVLALGFALSDSPVSAATRFELPAAILHFKGGWLSRILVHFRFAWDSGFSVDPDGGSDPNKGGAGADPNGMPDPNKSGYQLDPNGFVPAKP